MISSISISLISLYYILILAILLYYTVFSTLCDLNTINLISIYLSICGDIFLPVAITRCAFIYFPLRRSVRKLRRCLSSRLPSRARGTHCTSRLDFSLFRSRAPPWRLPRACRDLLCRLICAATPGRVRPSLSENSSNSNITTHTSNLHINTPHEFNRFFARPPLSHHFSKPRDRSIIFIVRAA